MKKLAELQKRLAALKGDGLNILQAAENEARDLSAEEEARYSQIEADIASVQGEISAAERLAERRRTMDALPSAPYGANTVGDTNPALTGGFRNLADFARSVHSTIGASRGLGGTMDSRLLAAPANLHEGGAASGEGYEVPPDFRDRIFTVVQEMDEFGPLIDEEPTAKREVKLTADETTPWGSSGIQAYWRSEGNQMTASKLATQPRSVPLHELYVLANITEELLEDGPRLNSRLSNGAAAAIAWKKNASIVYGTGSGQPLGWFNSSALVSVAKEAGQAADTIVSANVMKMFSRLLRVPGDKPFWMTNSDCLPQLMTLTLGDKPIWMPPNGLIDAPGGILLGLPVKFSEHAKTVGDKGDLQLVSPKGYYGVRRAAGVSFAQSMHLYFDYATETFRWIFRYGGQPHLSAPVSPANGAATKSHFVTLDARA